VLIGNTDNWLLRHSVQHGPVLKDVWVSAHAQRSVKGAQNVLLQSLSSTSTYRIRLQKLSLLSHLRPFSATFVLRMRKNGYLWTSGVNFDTAVRFANTHFSLQCKISAIWRRFPLIFAFYMPNVRYISTFGLFDLLTYKVYHTHRPHVDNPHQVWRRYDYPFLSFEL